LNVKFQNDELHIKEMEKVKKDKKMIFLSKLF